MRKSKVFINVATLFAVLVSEVFISCGALFGDGQSGNITINLPPISSQTRAISSDKISDLKNATTSYRVTVNGMTRKGTGGAFTFTLPVGVVAEITVECLNSSGNTIVRAKKTHTVTAGENNVDIILSQDGEVVGTDNTPTAPQPVPGKVIYDGNGADSGTPSDTGTYNKDDTVTLQTGEPTRIGYTFAGWTSNVALEDETGYTIPTTEAFVTSRSTSGVNKQISSFKMPSGGVVLTAKWQELPVRTVLYSDGKFIINELPQNRRSDVAVTKEYAAMKDDGSNYRFSSSVGSDVLWYDNRASVTSVEIGSDISPTSTENWFYELSNCTSMNLTNLDTSNVTTMESMFRYCSGLTSLDVSKFDTSKVTTMRNMFHYCSKVTSLDVSNFDTANVTDMYQMFRYCSGVTSLDVSNFDTSKVTDMGLMFYGCSKLTSLDVGNFDTSNVTHMADMFGSCSKLTSLDLSKFDTSKVTNMNWMFRYCSGLTSLDVSSFDTANVTGMQEMFDGCSKLTSLDLSRFDTSKVTNMEQMFQGCSTLTTIYASNNFITNSVTSDSDMFDGCTVLIGGQGTQYSSSNVGKDYARIDGGPNSDTPGYFTDIANKP